MGPHNELPGAPRGSLAVYISRVYTFKPAGPGAETAGPEECHPKASKYCLAEPPICLPRDGSLGDALRAFESNELKSAAPDAQRRRSAHRRCIVRRRPHA